jgi:DNA processing protein
MLGVTMSHPDTPLDDPYQPERDAWAVLAAVRGLGPIGFAALLQRFGTAIRILSVSSELGGVSMLAETPGTVDGGRARPITEVLARAIADAAQQHGRIVARLRALDVRVLTVEEPAYPARLAAVAMPPHVLYLRGDPESLSKPRAVAIVGTRRATGPGRTTAGRMATALVAADAAVISGLAYGIDGAAHEAAVKAGGTTVAVIGSGHAQLGPGGHDRLAAQILHTGGAVISELAPDTAPSKGTFPRRNRIISGLADATVVVEAPASSGALITASWALEQGRGCFLVPGSIDSHASSGCLAFLREWPGESRIVAGIPQLIADLGFGQDAESIEAATPRGARDQRLANATLHDLGLVEGRIARALVAGQATIDELVAVTDLPVATVLAGVTMLERRGVAVGAYGRYRPAGPLLRELPTKRDDSIRRTLGAVARSKEPVLP